MGMEVSLDTKQYSLFYSSYPRDLIRSYIEIKHNLLTDYGSKVILSRKDTNDMINFIEGRLQKEDKKCIERYNFPKMLYDLHSLHSLMKPKEKLKLLFY